MSEEPRHAPVSTWTDLQRLLRLSGHRRLVLVEGNRDWAIRWLTDCLGHLTISNGLYVGAPEDAADIDFPVASRTQARRWLGQELDCVVWDGWRGNSPDGIAALAGTLSAGGLMFWLMPPLSEWAGFRDPDYSRLGLDHSGSHAFAARLSTLLKADDCVVRVSPDNPTPIDQCQLPVRSVVPFQVGATPEQDRLVESLVRTGLGRRRRPLVVTADRGRGKSAALGIAAARLLEEGRQRILVTAPEESAVATLFRHARERSALARSEERLTFRSVDELLNERPDAELVIVDEAAGIPPNLLRQILLSWPRVVFATTVHGYEGAGRGFSLRFREVLNKETPQWKQVTLTDPIRWSDSDPLEPLTNRLFLLDANAPSADINNAAEPVVQRFDPATASEQRLREAFGLLVDAHYRTSPSDVRQWMDDPAAVSWTVTLGGRLCGVLWSTQEGDLGTKLASEISMGRRRVRGHMLAQSLAFHGGFAEAAEQKLLRVVRVAVTDDARHRGLGTTLVDAAVAYAEQQSLDGVGTSFGAESGLLAFWEKCGLTPVRMGLTREHSTGEMPMQMLRGTSESGQSLAASMHRRMAEHWQTLVPLHWADLDPTLLLALAGGLDADIELNVQDRRDLYSFAYGHRGFDLTLPVLRKLSLHKDMVSHLQTGQDATAALWCRAVMQGWSWQRLRLSQLCDGRDKGERQLRKAVRELIENWPDL